MAMEYYLESGAKKVGCKFEEPRAGDAGYDIYASEQIDLLPGESAWISTGLHVAVPNRYVGIVKERSSKAGQYHVHAGVIDSSYRGEVKVLVHNHVDAEILSRTFGHITNSVGVHVAKRGDISEAGARIQLASTVTIEAGEKIAQLLLIPVHYVPLTPIKKNAAWLEGTERGEDGFGSTGS